MVIKLITAALSVMLLVGCGGDDGRDQERSFLALDTIMGLGIEIDPENYFAEDSTHSEIASKEHVVVFNNTSAEMCKSANFTFVSVISRSDPSSSNIDCGSYGKAGIFGMDFLNGCVDNVGPLVDMDTIGDLINGIPLFNFENTIPGTADTTCSVAWSESDLKNDMKEVENILTDVYDIMGDSITMDDGDVEAIFDFLPGLLNTN